MFVAISIASYYDSYGNSCCLHAPEARPLSPWSRLGGCEAILGLTMTCFLGHTTRLISGGNSRYVVWQKSQAWEPQILVLMQANHTVNYSIFGNPILTHVTMSFDNFFLVNHHSKQSRHHKRVWGGDPGHAGTNSPDISRNQQKER
jgi:hypothetical protein